MVRGYIAPPNPAQDRCRMTNSHQPMGHPWSLTATCDRPKGHHNDPENRVRMHRQVVEGYTIMWFTEPDLP